MPTPSRVCMTGAFALSAVLLPLLAACSNEPLSSPRPQLDQAAAPPSWLVSNAVKYRDAGSHPATGRSGNATLTSRALLAKDGSTLIEASTGALDVPAAPPGQIASIQLKQLQLHGAPTWNYVELSSGGYWSQTYTSLSHGGQVQLQANIRGIDPSRTDVVTVLDTVKLRPDLAASGLTAPASAAVNAVVHVSATITELNREVGATADCILFADGQQVSAAEGIWVDAGDAVTCAFVTTFGTTGTKHLTITAANVRPADWDDSNNSVDGTIEIVSSGIRLAWSSTFTGWDEDFNQQYSDPSTSFSLVGSQQSRTVGTSGSVRDTTSAGTDVKMTASLTSGGLALGTASAAVKPIPWYSEDCRSGFDAATNTNFSFCRTSDGVTSMSAQSYSTRAVYYGYQYYAYNGYTQAMNADATSGFGGYAVGSTIAYDVKATDERGTTWDAPGSLAVSASSNRSDCQNTATYSCSGYIQMTWYSGRASGN